MIQIKDNSILIKGHPTKDRELIILTLLDLAEQKEDIIIKVEK